ncbi:protein disulfide-isomerase domain [Pelomyxa schiedti]|nr:protein disulfide-isomerase domain [Pelomyxa schiedti]
MTRLVCVGLLVLGVVWCVSAVDDAAGNVIVLDRSNISTITTGTWMLKLYAPWCGHCVRLAPIWKEFAKKASAEGLPLSVGEVDVSKDNSLQAMFLISSFPSIVHITDGKTRDYKGERTVEAFMKFAREGYLQEPVKWFGPASIPMRALAIWVTIVIQGRDFILNLVEIVQSAVPPKYVHVIEQYKLPIVAGVALAVPVLLIILGCLLVCCYRCVCCWRKPKKEKRQEKKVNEAKEADSTTRPTSGKKHTKPKKD